MYGLWSGDTLAHNKGEEGAMAQKKEGEKGIFMKNAFTTHAYMPLFSSLSSVWVDGCGAANMVVNTKNDSKEEGGGRRSPGKPKEAACFATVLVHVAFCRSVDNKEKNLITSSFPLLFSPS